MQNVFRVPMRAVLAALLVSATMAAPAWAKQRPGVIEEMQPIQNRGEDTSKRTRFGRAVGQNLGMLGGLAAATGLSNAGHAEAGVIAVPVAAAGGSKVGGVVGEKIAGEGPATRYMVKVRLDGGRVLSTTQLRENVSGLSVGSRVIVDGNGDEARITAE
ncbi:hypothetical protein [Stenotrophomonas sp. BIGb0135]|jgi:hypothetical protein|uniref:Glycine zipper 2TM domain-containing protein n=1 Tax=Stenotrophomonas nematodicola TaxID=2656746 RepID=A0ABW7CUU0_9GAMM|nr:hypothetical protein [Stenotrophomonas sp. BIGb0135]MCS4233125.1 hypothetical protein [Stenotrophomonas sp. BIGb0135]